MINLFQNNPLGFRQGSVIQSFCHSRASFKKNFCEMFPTWEKKGWIDQKEHYFSSFLRIEQFPPKLLAAFCSSHEVMFSSPEELHHCGILHLAPCKGSQMNITRHIKNNGFIRFKFLTRFPSKQQLSGFLSSSYHSENLVYHVKIQISQCFFFNFFFKCMISLKAKSSVYLMLYCLRTDYSALLPAGIVHRDVNQNVWILKSFRERIFHFYCSQPNFVWRRTRNQSCFRICLFFRLQNTCVQSYRPDSFHQGLSGLTYLCVVLVELIWKGNQFFPQN